MYNQWATAPGQSLNYPRPKTIIHLHTFSDNGVYVALQLFLVILVSDQCHQVLKPTVIDRRPGAIYMLGDDPPNIHGNNGFTWYPNHGRHSTMLKARFLHLTISVAAGIEPQTFSLPGQRVTTWPWLSKSCASVIHELISTFIFCVLRSANMRVYTVLTISRQRNRALIKESRGSGIGWYMAWWTVKLGSNVSSLLPGDLANFPFIKSTQHRRWLERDTKLCPESHRLHTAGPHPRCLNTDLTCLPPR